MRSRAKMICSVTIHTSSTLYGPSTFLCWNLLYDWLRAVNSNTRIHMEIPIDHALRSQVKMTQNRASVYGCNEPMISVVLLVKAFCLSDIQSFFYLEICRNTALLQPISPGSSCATTPAENLVMFSDLNSSCILLV